MREREGHELYKRKINLAANRSRKELLLGFCFAATPVEREREREREGD